jgi:lipid A ethanolaminephosphotransferase
LTAPWLALGVACFLATASNGPFWSALVDVAPIGSATGALFLVSVLLVLAALLNVCLLLVSFRWILKPVAIALLLVAAVCAHFMSAYGVRIDRELIQSTLETDVGEIRALIGRGFIVDLLTLGILPSLLVAWVPLQRRSLRREAAQRLVACVASLGLGGGLVFLHYQQFAFVGREHGHLRQLINPLGPIQAALRYHRVPTRGITRIGEDAHRATPRPVRRSLVVLVVGETARAASFSLNGYGRETNRELAALPVISFTRVRSCGTATAMALPCMFSPAGRRAFDVDQAAHQEGALDVLQRAGVSVLWRDNNSGCKHVCDRVPTRLRDDLAVPALCDGRECYDEVLLQDLQQEIDGMHGDALIVLHQQGSHGPAYHERSPGPLKRFLPECDGELRDCTRESIVNAYDNSIVYTDWLLARLIERLEANSARFDTAMLYVSDHGESLGEGGIYLHGLPWLLAPEEQTRVPMVLWLSEALKASLALDAGCVERSRTAPHSHDELFHSLLGLFGVSTGIYRPELDLFEPCRTRAVLTPTLPAASVTGAAPARTARLQGSTP